MEPDFQVLSVTQYCSWNFLLALLVFMPLGSALYPGLRTEKITIFISTISGYSVFRKKIDHPFSHVKERSVHYGRKKSKKNARPLDSIKIRIIDLV
jgi:hypothetical protein